MVAKAYRCLQCVSILLLCLARLHNCKKCLPFLVAVLAVGSVNADQKDFKNVGSVVVAKCVFAGGVYTFTSLTTGYNFDFISLSAGTHNFTNPCSTFTFTPSYDPEVGTVTQFTVTGRGPGSNNYSSITWGHTVAPVPVCKTPKMIDTNGDGVCDCYDLDADGLCGCAGGKVDDGSGNCACPPGGKVDIGGVCACASGTVDNGTGGCCPDVNADGVCDLPPCSFGGVRGPDGSCYPDPDGDGQPGCASGTVPRLSGVGCCPDVNGDGKCDDDPAAACGCCAGTEGYLSTIAGNSTAANDSLAMIASSSEGSRLTLVASKAYMSETEVIPLAVPAFAFVRPGVQTPIVGPTATAANTRYRLALFYQILSSRKPSPLTVDLGVVGNVNVPLVSDSGTQMDFLRTVVRKIVLFFFAFLAANYCLKVVRQY